MTSKMRLIPVLMMLVAALVVTVQVVAANPVEDYRASMRSFLPVIEDWSAELQKATYAAAVKPSPEAMARVNELAVRGSYILDDLRGTAELTPQPLVAAHWQLADAIGTMVTAAESVSEDPTAAAELIDGQVEFAQPAMSQVWNFVTRFGAQPPRDIPVQPGTGS